MLAPRLSTRRKRRTPVRRFFVLLRDDRLDIASLTVAASVGGLICHRLTRQVAEVAYRLERQDLIDSV